jgi:predicted nucleotidyltransferase
METYPSGCGASIGTGARRSGYSKAEPNLSPHSRHLRTTCLHSPLPFGAIVFLLEAPFGRCEKRRFSLLFLLSLPALLEAAGNFVAQWRCEFRSEQSELPASRRLPFFRFSPAAGLDRHFECLYTLVSGIVMKKTIHREDILSYLASKKRYLREKYRINYIALIGSFARNEQTPASDIDLVIDLEENTPHIFELKRSVKDELEKHFGRPVDLASKRYLKPYYRNQILRDAIHV